MYLRYKTMEDVVLAALGLRADVRGSVLPRTKRLMKFGIPASANVGARKAVYSINDVLELTLAHTMLRADMAPQTVATFLSKNRERLETMWAKARRGEQVDLVTRLDTMAWPEEEARPAERKYKPKAAELLGPWDPLDERPLPVTTINLTELLKRVRAAFRMVRAARMLAADMSLSDKVIDEAFAELG